MRAADCYRENFSVEWSPDTWKESKVKEFVEFVCDKLGVLVPIEANGLFLRVKIDRELVFFFRKETEVNDFFNICVNILLYLYRISMHRRYHQIVFVLCWVVFAYF